LAPERMEAAIKEACKGFFNIFLETAIEEACNKVFPTPPQSVLWDIYYRTKEHTHMVGHLQ
jgi:hypothetical protein